MKIKSFYLVKHLVEDGKTNYTLDEVFANYISDKRLVFDYIENSQNSTL